MSEQAARDAVIRMATDPEFREGVRGDDPAVFAGLDLTEAEVAQLRSLSSDDSGAGVEQLAARLSKSGMFFTSSLASLHSGADAPHAEAGSYTPEQHDAAPVPLTEHPVTFHEGASSNAPPGGGNEPAASYAPPGGGNYDEASAPVPLTEHPVTFHEGGQDNPTNDPQPQTHGWVGTPFPTNTSEAEYPTGGGFHEGGFTGGVLPSGAGEAHSLLNHPTDGGPAAQGAPVHHGDAGYEKPDKPDGGPKPPKLDALISDRAANPDAAHSGAHGDAGYEKPDKPDGGPKPPKLDSFISHDAANPAAAHSDAGQPQGPDDGGPPPKVDGFISDRANVEGAHEETAQSGYYGGTPATEG